MVESGLPVEASPCCKSDPMYELTARSCLHALSSQAMLVKLAFIKVFLSSMSDFFGLPDDPVLKDLPLVNLRRAKQRISRDITEPIFAILSCSPLLILRSGTRTDDKLDEVLRLKGVKHFRFHQKVVVGVVFLLKVDRVKTRRYAELARVAPRT